MEKNSGAMRRQPENFHDERMRQEGEGSLSLRWRAGFPGLLIGLACDELTE
jgi:hypothetical protein